MILKDATYEAYGYEVWELPPQSDKPILAACDDCGEERETSKHAYYSLCLSCAMKGKTNAFGHKHTEKSKAKQSVTMIGKYSGKKNPNFGKTTPDAIKAKISASMKGKNHYNYGKHGAECSSFRGGLKAAWKRSQAKRKRELGYILLCPLEEGEVGHHIDNEHVIGIPKEVHAQFSGYTREKHRALVLKWLKVNDKKKYRLVFLIFKNRNM